MLYGRDREVDVIAGVLDAALDGRGAALVVRGEAGIGKTSLLEAALGGVQGFRVLRATGAEFEMELAFAGLHALCGQLLDGIARLPAPQREALDAAFGRREGVTPDPLRVGIAVLTLLSESTGAEPIVCVIDDAQWLDRASAQALAFAARRIGAERVAMLFGVREPLTHGELAALPALRLDGLSDEDARALLGSALRVPLDEAVADRIVVEARGNPLILRELPLAAPPGVLAGGFAVSLRERPDDGLFRARLEGLAGDTRLLLLLAAAEPLGDPGLLWRAAGRLGLGPGAATPAEAAGLIDIADTVRFHHPLVRSAVYRPASAEDRRRVHAALAWATDEVAEPDRHAWHRAQAAAGPDEDVAGELVRSADRALARGGIAAAAAFLERAARLTPDAQRRLDRTLAAADARLQAGEPDVALGLLRRIRRADLDAAHTAYVDRLQGRISFSVQRGVDAPPLLRRAAQRLEPLDAGAARDAHLEALFAAVAVGSLGDALAEAAAVALDAPPPPGEPGLSDLLLDGIARVVAGDRRAGAEKLKGALARPLEEVSAFPPAVITLVCLELWDLDRYVAILTEQVKRARAAGALTQLPQALGNLAGSLLPKGLLREAEALLDEADALALATGTVPPYPRLHLAALRGDEGAARALTDSVVADARARGEGLLVDYAHFTDALLFNGLGRYAEALDAARTASINLPFGLGGLGLRELVEAAAREGAPEAAEAALAELRTRTHAADTEWAAGIEASSAALLSEAPAADRLHQTAITHLEAGECAADLARAQLLYGESLRRDGRRLDARAQLRSAHERLSDIGARALADRALRELRATGERARPRRPEAAQRLTAQETRIARLVATGATSKEVAAELFLSPRTVDAHLRSIFRKLDITSRRQLRRMAIDDVG